VRFAREQLQQPIEADLLLVAVGRGPVSSDLGLEVMDRTRKGDLSVDPHCHIDRRQAWLPGVACLERTHVGARVDA
jgi:pyruvate/2-oxoglutarate dehydrogenase complex dihydrolipoamide dehydrogenase (E3) component